MTAKQPSQKTAKPARQKSAPVYDTREAAPTSLGEALLLDLRTCSRAAKGRIAIDLEIAENTLDQWVHRFRCEFNQHETKAIICHTGGRHYLAFAVKLMLQCGDNRGDGIDLIQSGAGVVSSASDLLREIADSVSPGDDSPNVIDDKERVRLGRQVHDVIGQLIVVYARVMEGE